MLGLMVFDARCIVERLDRLLLLLIPFVVVIVIVARCT